MSATNAPTDPSDLRAVSAAISDLDTLITQHQRSARQVAISVAAAFILLILAGLAMHLVETYLAVSVLSDFKAAAERLTRASLAGSQTAIPAQMDLSSLLYQEIKPQVDAIADHAKTAGVQYYNALLISGAAVFSLVFGILMSVYRHHLTEISKLQHSKIAFTRVRVAMRSTEGGERNAIVQAALLDRAFEYRSGKEKQIESPVPGHPAADASALLIDKLVEAIAQSRRPQSGA